MRVPGTSWDSTAEGISCFGASAPFSVRASSSEIKRKCKYHSLPIWGKKMYEGKKKSLNELSKNKSFVHICKQHSDD